MRFFALLVVFACLNLQCSDPSNRQDNILNVALEARPQAIDPRYSLDAASSRIGEIIFSRLVKYNEKLEIVPDLATSWEISNDGLRFRFFLRENVRFQDGSTLDASDVAYTFQSIMDPEQASPKRMAFDVIDRIEVESPLTITFHLKRQDAAFLNNMIPGIVPENSKKEGLPIGSGPFQMIENQNGSLIRLQAFKDYFGGPPALDGIVFRHISDVTMRVLELEKGAIDLVQNDFIPEFIPALRRDPHLKVLAEPGINCSYLGMNLKHKALSQLKVRQAIAHAIDRETIQTLILRDTATLAEQILGPSVLGYDPQLRLPTYDPAKAKQLLAEAGFPKISLVYKTSTDKLRLRIAEILRRNLAEVGIDVRIQSYEFSTFFTDIKQGNFDLYSLTWVGLAEPDGLFNIFHSTALPPQGANRVFYSNPLVDELLSKGRTTLEKQERQQIYQHIGQILTADLPLIPLWYTNNVACMRADVEGFRLYPGGNYYSLAEVRFKGKPS